MNPRLNRSRRGLVARSCAATLVLALAAAGCGSDDDDAATSTTTVAATDTTSVPASEATTSTSGVTTTDDESDSGTDLVAFCDSFISYDMTDSPGGGEEPTVEELQGYGELIAGDVEVVAANAPEDAAAAATAFQDGVIRLMDGDATAYDDPAIFKAIEDLEQSVRSNCDVNAVGVVAMDFEFALPSSIPAGAISFSMTNDGEQPHVFILMQAPPDVSDDATLLRDMFGPEDGSGFAPYFQYFVAGNPPFAEPGLTGTTVKVLEPGEYIYFCPIPVDFEDPNAALHFDSGMHGRVVVEA